MSRRSLRFVLGSQRARARTTLLELRGRTRRRPPCARIVPRPPTRRSGDAPLSLTHALLACDLNPRYLDLWPLARRAWAELAGLEPVLVLVGSQDVIPAPLRDDPSVRVFDPLPHLHTAFQAQCIRLLFPALIEGSGVVVSDVDMVPLGPRYLARPLGHVRASDFVAYRDVVLDLGEIPVCYNAARPETWGSVFGVRDLSDVRMKLAEWGEDVAYAGTHDGEGWTTDQRTLYRVLVARGRQARDVWILDDYYTGFRRLERTYVEKWRRLSPTALEGIRERRFSDFHLLPPDSELAHLNELAVEEAVAAGRR